MHYLNHAQFRIIIVFAKFRQSIVFSVRNPLNRIADKIIEQLHEGRIVTCVEMDHYSWFLRYLREREPSLDIRGHYCPKIDRNKDFSNSNLSLYIVLL